MAGRRARAQVGARTRPSESKVNSGVTIPRMASREIRTRPLTFLLSTAAVFLAVGVIAGQMLLLNLHESRVNQILRLKDLQTSRETSAMRRDFLGLAEKHGYQVLVLSGDQDLHEFLDVGYADFYMEESVADRLATADIDGVTCIRPALVTAARWPEQFYRSVRLYGDAAECGPDTHVESGSASLGSELCRKTGIAPGDSVTILGTTFTVAECRGQMGTNEDITIRLTLKDLQALVDRDGMINEIRVHATFRPAESAADTWANEVERLRNRIVDAAPGTQAVVRETEISTMHAAVARAEETAEAAIAREKAHQETTLRNARRFARTVVPIVSAVGAVLVALLTGIDARDRSREIGILLAVGCRRRRIALLFALKGVAAGLVGGILGIAGGTTFALTTGEGARQSLQVAAAIPELAVLAGLSVLVTGTVSSMPAVRAARSSPSHLLS